MKKILLSLGFALMLATTTYAQAKVEVDGNAWQHADLEETGVFGVNTQKALDYLKSKNRKPQTITVGVLDSGVEVTHEDLVDNIYVNAKEVAGNNKDDDKNGYIDDVHGWNFIGGPTGNVDGDTMEFVRILKELTPLFTGDKAEANIAKHPEKYELYKEVKQKYENDLAEAKTYAEQYNAIVKMYKEPLVAMSNELGDIVLTMDNIQKNKAKFEKHQDAMAIFSMVDETAWKDKTVKEFADEIIKDLDGAVSHFTDQTKYHLNLTEDFRKIVGDDYTNKKEKNYGNNDVDGPDSNHGTHVAGIIAAKRGNKIGMDGVAGDGYVKILSVRTVPNGDERDKDVANAIRYATDNGAKILNMSFGKAYSPEKDLVWEAFKYAESKGVLLVKAAGNDNLNIDEEVHYPTVFNDKGERVSKNVITVGSSTIDPLILKSSFSNYGKKSVDVFAPGSNIYSAVPTREGKYQSNSGTSMASPVVAGVAALVWAHYPKLKVEQVRQIILESVNKDPQLTEISVTGGVVDAYKAVQLAEKMYANVK